MASAVTAVTLTVAFAGLALGVPWFWVAFPVGFGGVLPVATTLARRRASDGGGGAASAIEHSEDGASAVDGRNDAAAATEEGADTAADRGEEAALTTLQERYARGEIDDIEFERRVETVLETE